MTKKEIKRREITERIADYLLTHGLYKASLRPMAAALGTSDRMLLHYFTDKEELLNASLLLVADRLIRLLENARADKMPFRLLVPHLAGMLKNPTTRPFLKLWLELAALSYDEAHYRKIAQQICNVFLEWIESMIDVKNDSDLKPMASLAFATIEGLVLLDAIGSDSLIMQALEGVERC